MPCHHGRCERNSCCDISDVEVVVSPYCADSLQDQARHVARRPSPQPLEAFPSVFITRGLTRRICNQPVCMRGSNGYARSGAHRSDGEVMVFRNREEAGRLLAAKLESYRDDPSGLILALPRGGVAIGYELSLALHLPLDVFITRKLSAPDNPEYAIGALSETGAIYLNPDAVEAFQLSHAELDALIKGAREEISRRQERYRNGLPLAAVTDRTVILVDDGIATGATFFATIEAISELSPRRLVAAIPVAPQDSLAPIRSRVDDLIVLATPDPFMAVGHHYRSFAQVEDAEVLEYLSAAKQSRPAHVFPR